MYRFAPNPKQLNIDGVYRSKEGTTLKFETHQNVIYGSIWTKDQNPTTDPPGIIISGKWLRAGPLEAFLQNGTWHMSGTSLYLDGEADFYFDEHEKKVKVEVRLFVSHDPEKYSIWRGTKIR
ncbi:hypothetical protein GOP56_22910 [Brevibacillus sp. 7WMA2]|uniref:hypothetical protein n=1 Tax=Brevibacillus sp. 7WMA2 TaxID=2683193 RepID=UPI0013A794AC|nr:hypothetical protein [Brevibacillus sp. 7WMA2]QIC08192.1 hypothetical protein GOP56_22910 [Brevibacillus sp. 7WMA2]